MCTYRTRECLQAGYKGVYRTSTRVCTGRAQGCLQDEQKDVYRPGTRLMVSTDQTQGCIQAGHTVKDVNRPGKRMFTDREPRCLQAGPKYVYMTGKRVSTGRAQVCVHVVHMGELVRESGAVGANTCSFDCEAAAMRRASELISCTTTSSFSATTCRSCQSWIVGKPNMGTSPIQWSILTKPW